MIMMIMNEIAVLKKGIIKTLIMILKRVYDDACNYGDDEFDCTGDENDVDE